MKFAHVRQHKQKAEPIRKDGSQYIVMEEETSVFRGSEIACKRYVRTSKQEECHDNRSYLSYNNAFLG